MKDKLNRMKAECLHKQNMIDAKKRLNIVIQEKMGKFEEFKFSNMSTEDEHSKKIQFPFVVVCHEKAPATKTNEEMLPEPELKKEERKPSVQRRLSTTATTSTVPVWKASKTPTTSSFMCCFNKGDKVEIMGELDLISKWKKPVKASTAKPRRR